MENAKPTFYVYPFYLYNFLNVTLNTTFFLAAVKGSHSKKTRRTPTAFAVGFLFLILDCFFKK